MNEQLDIMLITEHASKRILHTDITNCMEIEENEKGGVTTEVL